MRTLSWPLGRRDMDEALGLLRGGALVVHPTEAVFGIGVALSAGQEGIERVRAAKRSASDWPFLVLAASPAMAFSLWAEVPSVGEVLGASAWPGPLTLVGAARPGLPPGLLGRAEGSDGPVATVSVRVPADAALRQLLGRLGEPLLSTSANLAGLRPPSHAADIDLDGLAPDLFLRVEACGGGEPSTVLTMIEDPPRILRQGAWRPTLDPDSEIPAS
jgi:L-threonylcarbamoyladenylate synthase